MTFKNILDLQSGITKKCIQCNTSYSLKRKSLIQREKSKFCSKKCQDSYHALSFIGSGNPHWKGGKIEHVCLICEKKFNAKIYKKDAKYCSQQCLHKSRSIALKNGGPLYIDGRSSDANHRLQLGLLHSSRRRAKKIGNGGSHTLQDWKILLEKFNYKCLKCGSTKRITRDHINPISLGGTDDIENIQPLCLRCNIQKWTKNIDYRGKIWQ